ncbi:MAG: PASTA domain-containing protein, partial [Actinomycetota bacterium]|nr:PASTA domain-containing protein [Actinomycetota bacterium]
PDLLGLPMSDVTPVLQEFRDDTGIQFEWMIEHLAIDDATLWGVVVSTDPAAGSAITDGATIKVIIGKDPGS